MSRSTDTLTKSTTTDYKKMISNGSIDSMDKSALGSETSYDLYDSQNGTYSTRPPASGYDDMLNDKFSDFSEHPKGSKKSQEPKVYGLPTYNPQGFELSYKNEGFRDNSTYTGTRNNSLSTYINEDTPIIHQTDPEDANSDYYGNSSTLPMRAKGENLSFLTEFKNKLPDYEKLSQHKPEHSSFLPAPPTPPYDQIHLGNKRSPIQSSKHNDYEQPTLQKPSSSFGSVQSSSVPSSTTEIRRPSSYYTAMQSARDSRMPVQSQQKPSQKHYPKPPQPPPLAPPPQPPPLSPKPQTVRPKTIYEASDNDNRPAYPRSKSEALLETNFDEETPNRLTSDSRSYSQPLETAM